MSPYPDLVTENARYIAERDINGVYMVLLKVAPPELVMQRLLTVALHYLDFGQSQGEFVAPRVFRAAQPKERMGKERACCYYVRLKKESVRCLCVVIRSLW